MTKDDTGAIKLGDIAEALVLLTRLPVSMGEPRGAQAAWAWPVAGLVVGAIGALIGGLGWALGLPISIAAGLAVAAQVIATGGMHEDGLADCADGFWGAREPARRLEIMKDSRIGAYGVLALVFAIGLRWQAVGFLFSYGYVIAPMLVVGVLSRVPMVVLMHRLDFARQDGLARHVGSVSGRIASIAALIGALVALFGFGFWAVPLAIATIAVTLAWGALARAKIGGQTGDVHGGAQQITEITLLMLLCALI